ncbi:tRNA (adenosine(37)-N6)-dimethylallyltransferase MiaA [Mucilaginibacter sp. HMF5004]|uniref:tRNA (adenosine(37)-N6)-dimethylallyltransferase MiaA n=1 Tax=Mucilaginibacter rivuli TaxID=2857527 RepID=UPI001C6069AD|nr:tRNA (adenosine(37)-N6)-dimethylallyltransferase MiaA [Mucilaginibacter rivuli]MBW4890844.1 tRNA (adenosine(37)-N6)-dimethylallyltransferase MiaA [Mucilaginibacter rivuli]
MNKPSAQKTLIVIAGPTAVGKTALAIELAKHYQTEIVSADSRQYYREMAIGTAKPDADELSQAKHHFVNSHSVTDSYNVGDFETDGLKVIDQIFETHDKAILAGGSGLYIKAICEGFDALPPVDVEVRNELNALYAEKGLKYLQERLKTEDPGYFEQVDEHNPQRIIRALEVMKTSGKLMSSFHTANVKERPFKIVKIGLNLPRELLYQRINMRVDAMVRQGLIDEVKGLLPYRDYNALNTVGYTEIFDYFDGTTSLEDAIALIKQNTRRFAKRQLTWFNKDKSMHWFAPNQLKAIIELIDKETNENSRPNTEK